MTCEALFHDVCFLIVFLPIVLIGYWVVPSLRWKLAWVTAASFVFYSFWDLRFVWLLVASSLVDFSLALQIARTSRKKRWLAISIAFNLGLLAVFKYAMFAAENARSIFSLLHIPIEVPYFSIVLPVGISFYTFQTLSYTIDVYRGEVAPTRDLVKYLAFVTMFPQLIAGPIVRYSEVSEQLDKLPRRLSWGFAAGGILLITVGLVKKLLIADVIGRRIAPLWLDTGGLDTVGAWVAAAGFTLQIYFDFSGYSDMALGLGALLGLSFPVNFYAPYGTRNMPDTWRRWHMTLTRYIRDYFVVPVAGTGGSTARAAGNVVLLMVLVGFWHGASWTFILFGLYHAFFLLLYRAVRRPWDASPVVLQHFMRHAIVIVGFVLFAAADLSGAWNVYVAMFSWRDVGVGLARHATLVAIVLTLLLFVTFARPSADLASPRRKRTALLCAIAFCGALVLSAGDESPFLYYQF